MCMRADNNGFDAEKLEIHSLLYENGARCVDSSKASGRYCEIPVRGEVSRGGGSVDSGFCGFDGDGAGGFAVWESAGDDGGCGVAGGGRLDAGGGDDAGSG